MRRSDSPPPDPLTEAASALATDLRSLEELSASLRKEPLTSQKSLERAAELLREAADSDAHLGVSARKLVEVIGAARGRQERATQVVKECADRVGARTEAFQRLLKRSEQLGQLAAQINQAVVQTGGAAKAGESAGLGEVLPSLVGSTEQAAAAAQELVELAERDEFPDVGRSADSLRQQLLAARNKLSLLSDRLSANGIGKGTPPV